MSASASAARPAWLRTVARTILGIWIVFWTYFLGANLLDNLRTTSASEQAKGYLAILTGLVLIWGLGVLAWRKERVGASLLVGLGLALLIGYLLSPPTRMVANDVVSTALLLGGVPFLAGFLFWAAPKR
ncbi:MAG: hypothetical protein H6505_06385 [Calditrichaeota bacterium]|nr:hypothetical protein [Calditrichota bacterium]